MAMAAGLSEKNVSGSAVWQGRLKALSAVTPTPTFAAGPSAQPGTNNSLKRTLIASHLSSPVNFLIE
jgi:hypothetical protein